MDLSNKRILVLGGAGFLGSNIVLLLLSKGIKVTVIDGLMPKTGGSIANLPSHNNLLFIKKQVDNIHDLKELIHNE